MSFKRLEQNTKRLSDPRYIDGLIMDAAKKYEAEMIDLNTGQLEKGKLSTGENISPEYSPAYAEFKGRKVPDLKLEGDFYSGFNIDFRDDSMIFDSSDSKSDKLANKYSDDIFGLDDKSKVEAAELIREDFQESFLDELTKGF